MVVPASATSASLAEENSLLRKEVARLLSENTTLRQHPDHLTGLMLRPAWEPAAEQRLPTLRRPALVFADVNGLKDVNDNHGHYLGDRLLRGFAARLRTQFGDESLIGRIGGDEFVILLDLPPTWRTWVSRAASACTVSVAGMTCGAAFGLARPTDLARRDLAEDPHAQDAATVGHGQLDRLMHAADLALLRAKRLCHKHDLPTALRHYGLADPAIPAELDNAPPTRARDTTRRTRQKHVES
ncbi:MAG TPA: GGDEF domain-containing protein [Pseudonocardiaceae bacterium]|jgi:GGDEF domain-containing protein